MQETSISYLQDTMSTIELLNNVITYLSTSFVIKSVKNKLNKLLLSLTIYSILLLLLIISPKNYQ